MHRAERAVSGEMRRFLSNAVLPMLPSAGRSILLALALGFLCHTQAEAQFFGHNFPADLGVQSGSQPPPGFYASLLVPYYSADKIVLEEGVNVGSPTTAVNVWGLSPILTVVTNASVFGANYGFVIAPSFANVELEFPRLEVDENQFGLGDLYVAPVQLGWHFASTDVIASLGFFAPTGRYEAGAADNIGLGMWSFEFSVGATQYFDRASTWSTSLTAYYEIHTKKQDVDIRAGDWLVLKGGAGKAFTENVTLGVSYYALWQTTDATGADVPEEVRGRKIRSFGVGPEVDLLGGGVLLRVLWEFGVQNTLQGVIAALTLTLPL